MLAISSPEMSEESKIFDCFGSIMSTNLKVCLKNLHVFHCFKITHQKVVLYSGNSKRNCQTEQEYSISSIISKIFLFINPSRAKATFVKSTRSKRISKTI